MIAFVTHQAAMRELSWVLESRKESGLTSNSFVWAQLSNSTKN